MNKKRTGLIAIFLSAAILGSYIYGFQIGLEQTLMIPQYYGFHGQLEVLVEKYSGTFYYETSNIVVTIGKTRAKHFLGWDNASAGATQYLSLSNDGSPLASWTKLPNEITATGLDRATGTVTNINATAYQVQNKWTATGSVTCQTGGVHWVVTDDSDNNLWAAADFTQTSLSNNENITLTWTINHA